MFKKLQIDKKFTPASTEEEDELFRNGIFTFNITQLLSFLKSNLDQFPLEEIEVNQWRRWSSEHLNEFTIQTANLKNPLLLAEISPGNWSVIDGHHRLEKAYREGVDKISAYRVDVHDHINFLTTEWSYQKYIEYWNDKVEELSCFRKGRKKKVSLL